MHKINLVCNDYDLVSLLEGQVNVEQVDDVIKKIKGTKLEKVALEKLNRFNERKKQKDCAIHMFRYVVGKMFALVWINNFHNSTNFEKSNMIKNYVKYLKNTHKFDLYLASNHLFNKNFTEICLDFKNLLEQQLEF
jgi:hypothetical protein